VLVILANCGNRSAQLLAERWSHLGARLLTPSDLSLEGWRVAYGTDDRRLDRWSTAVVGGEVVPTDQITGVLTRLPVVFEHELMTVVPEDRAYVAAEMTAFLLAWLTQLPCPVLNRPTATGLSGPNWRRERWVAVAAQLAIPCRSVRRQTHAPGDGRRSGMGEWDPHLWGEVEAPPNAATVTVVGNRVIGNVHPSLRRSARRLAERAGAQLLAVRFEGAAEGARLIGVDPLPDLLPEEVADAMLDYLKLPARPAADPVLGRLDARPSGRSPR
jgi:hypothetical protein